MPNAFEQAILDDLSEAGPWHVYADWLMSRGDVRGELMAAALAGKGTPRLLEENAERFLGRFATDLAHTATFGWYGGSAVWEALSGLQTLWVEGAAIELGSMDAPGSAG